jgi:anti-anti-sigma regulatory factor
VNHFDDQRERLNFNIMKAFLESHKFIQFQKEFTEKLAYEIEQKIQENLKTCTPELLVNFTQVYRDLTLNFKEINKMMKDIERKSKKNFPVFISHRRCIQNTR